MAEGTGRTLSTNEKKKFDFGSWIIIYISAALFIFLSLTRSNFFNFNNIHSILYGVSFNFFAAIGFTLLIIMGELDMSVGSLFGFGGAMMGYFVFTYRLPVGAAMVLAMLLALAIGLCAGFLVVQFRLNSMMVTIGVMMAVKGFNWMMVNKFGGRQLPSEARNFVSVDFLSIRWSIWLMLVIAIIMEILLNKSWHFKQLYYIGHNMDTTILYGLKAGRVKILCFGLSAAVSAFGGCLMTARLARPDVTVGANLEISIITAAVIGGASIFGGRGSIVRSMLGVFFIFLLQNGMTAYNIDSYIQQIVVGTILVAAIYLDLRFNRKKG
ncbi:ABC transporter permease [Colidextribacter sp. OB.20]|uniref:ABC transporter permease n=1 Tax=Colidextribacter sp. OB.20 TaxID=2304568 RepID=UPI001371FFE3|nr:ABC transporter permease [Colidextribacter sp. OB.20]